MTPLNLLEALTSSVTSALHLQEVDWTALNPDPGTGTGTTGGDGGPFDFQDVPPSAPPEVKKMGERIFGAMKFGAGIIAVLCFTGAGIMIMFGKNRSHNLAAQGMSNAVSVIMGLGVVLGAVSIVGFFANG
ncbi:TrbC/VirB2 family protein [Streptosporangium canum]|uniref:TrbC/VirB2 family protein n=1 Tax=Streptosporangium canum TaxID=324952 RepID=UPI0036C53AF7